MGSRPYWIAQVTDDSHLVPANAPDRSGVVQYSVESQAVQLSGGTFNNNGWSDKMPSVIYLGDATDAVVSGVTATDNRSSRKTQMGSPICRTRQERSSSATTFEATG
jgi:hypothetical protein